MQAILRISKSKHLLVKFYPVYTFCPGCPFATIPIRWQECNPNSKLFVLYSRVPYTGCICADKNWVAQKSNEAFQ